MVAGFLMLENLGGGGPSARPSPRKRGEGERARAPSSRQPQAGNPNSRIAVRLMRAASGAASTPCHRSSPPANAGRVPKARHARALRCGSRARDRTAASGAFVPPGAWPRLCPRLSGQVTTADGAVSALLVRRLRADRVATNFHLPGPKVTINWHKHPPCFPVARAATP
jgi:hypothetical protein